MKVSLFVAEVFMHCVCTLQWYPFFMSHACRYACLIFYIQIYMLIAVVLYRASCLFHDVSEHLPLLCQVAKLLLDTLQLISSFCQVMAKRVHGVQ